MDDGIRRCRINSSCRDCKALRATIDLSTAIRISDEYIILYLYKQPVIGDDETEENDGTDADKWLERVRIERLLQRHIHTHKYMIHDVMDGLHWKTGRQAGNLIQRINYRTKTVLNDTKMREIEQVIVCKKIQKQAVTGR